MAEQYSAANLSGSAPYGLSIHTLGQLSIQSDGAPLTGFASTKTALLFIYLALNPHEHPREALAALFWSDTDDAQALKNLRTALSSLNKQLGDYLNVSRASIQIHKLDDIWIDAHRFEQLCTELPPAGDADVQTTLQARDELLLLYRDEFLSGLRLQNAPELDNWISLQRDRLRQYVINALNLLVDHTARLQRFAEGIELAQLLVSIDPLWDQAQRQLIRLLALAGQRSQAMQHYVSFEQLLQAELLADPEPQTTQLYEQIKSGNFAASHQLNQTPNNLHLPGAPFIEPRDQIRHLHETLDRPDCRLLTLVGIGGSGKTYLALHAAYQRLAQYLDGVFFLQLASLDSTAYLPQMMMQELGIAQVESNQSAAETLLQDLRARKILLVFDNYEHLLPDTRLIQSILAAAPNVQILVTSREQLNLQNEWLLPVNGLSISDDETDLAEAIRLFETTAHRLRPDFDIQDHFEAVVRLCRMVEGLPLGVAMAAGWTQFLPPTEIVRNMEKNLEFLTTVRSDVPLRHQSLQTVLDYTWSDLSHDQRSILAKLSVLRGRFAIDAALAISGATPIQLAQLISKSLLQGYDDYHYVLHELVRRYALEKLRESDDLIATCAAYTTWAQNWFTNLRDRRLLLHEYLAEIDLEYHHIWNFDWMPPAQQQAYFLIVCGYLGTYWIIREIHQAEAIRILETALQTEALDPILQATSLIQLGRLYLNEKRYARAAATLQEGIAACQSNSTMVLEGLAFVWLRESQVAHQSDPTATASIPVDQSFVPSEHQTQEIVSAAYSRLVLLYFELEDYENAAALLSIVSKHYEHSKMNEEAAIYRNLRGIIALKQADYKRARQHFDKALNHVASARQPLLQAAIQRNRNQADS